MSSGKYRKEKNCLNCGTHVEKHYCTNCGQPNLELKENFWDFISHSIAHYFHFDNKFFKTLTPLLSKPGQVTLDYLAGKRARYLNPVSMYIFVSILYFLMVASPKHDKNNKEEIKKDVVAEKAVIDSVTTQLRQSGTVPKSVIEKIRLDLSEEIDNDEFRAMNLEQQKLVLAELELENKKNPSKAVAKRIKKFEAIHYELNDSTYTAYLARQNSLPAMERDNIFTQYLKKRSIEMGEHSDVIQQKLENNRPKVYFLLMPLMAFFIMLNFRKNHIHYLDHLIFTIHGMTAYFLVVIISSPFTKWIFVDGTMIHGFIKLGIIIWIGWYMYQSLKIFYQRKKWTTIWKMVWIIGLYGLAFKLSEMVVLNIIYYVSV